MSSLCLQMGISLITGIKLWKLKGMKKELSGRSPLWLTKKVKKHPLLNIYILEGEIKTFSNTLCMIEQEEHKKKHANICFCSENIAISLF